jgi:hypothetical protein
VIGGVLGGDALAQALADRVSFGDRNSREGGDCVGEAPAVKAERRLDTCDELVEGSMRRKDRKAGSGALVDRLVRRVVVRDEDVRLREDLR